MLILLVWEETFVHSNKSKRLLSINGYIFYLNKSTLKVTYWKCEQKTCSAGVHLDSHDRFIKFSSADHTHMPVPARVEIGKLITDVKARVINGSAAIGQIYQEELVKANLSRSPLAVASTAREARKKIFVSWSTQSLRHSLYSIFLFSSNVFFEVFSFAVMVFRHLEFLRFSASDLFTFDLFSIKTVSKFLFSTFPQHTLIYSHPPSY